MADGRPVPGSVWFYVPSKIAPAIFTSLFLLTGLWHTYQCIRYKAWKITGLHPFCCTLFTVGFALRVYGAWDIDNVTILIVSTICIYSAPPVLELANYHVLGRILYYVPYHAPLHPGRTLTTFGTVSFVVEMLNALGVALLTNPNVSQKRQDLGHILMKTALITQILVMASFLVIAGIFHARCRKSGIKNKNVDGVLITMYTSTFYIMFRTVYRVVEHFGISHVPANAGPDWDPMTLSPVVRYEWYFYVFEAGLMLSNSLLWNTRHPRQYLPEDYHVYLAQDGISELCGPGWKTDQNWLMSFIDPFGWFTKKAPEQKPFWEENGYGYSGRGSGGYGAGHETAYGGAVVEGVPLVKRGDRQDV